jgi:peptidase M28-like protein
MYRVTWTLVALPLLIAAFTVGRPGPLPRPDLPPSFDAASAAQVARYLARRFPNRVPGSEQAAEATSWVRDRLREYHLTVEEQHFEADLPGHGRVQLVNLVARPLDVGPERSAETVVVMADRDNLDLAPGLDRNASGTAALIELARELSTLTVAHTIVFVSTDGGAWGGLGAAHLAEDETFRDQALVVVNLDSAGGPGTPRVELAGEQARSPAAALVATADASLSAEIERQPEHANPFNQLLDLGFPINFYGQAPLLGHGISALTLTAGASRPVEPGVDSASFTQERLGEIGRAAQTVVLSVDGAAEVASGTESYIYLGGRVLRGFAIQLFLLVALLPVIVTTLDLWARLRRRELALGAALRSYRSRLGVWLWGGGLAALFTLVGLFPNGEPRPLPLDSEQAQQWPFAALAGLVALTGLGWLVARTRLVPRANVDRGEELAGHLAAMLVLCAVAIAVAVMNVYALVFVLPSLHAWLWAPHVRDSGLGRRALVFGTGLAGPAGLLAATALRFDLGLDAPWYVTTLFTTGYAPLGALLLLLAWGAAAGQIGSFLFGRYAPYPTEDDRPVRGVVRESVRQTVLLGRRLGHGRRAPAPRGAPEPVHPIEREPLPRP